MKKTHITVVIVAIFFAAVFALFPRIIEINGDSSAIIGTSSVEIGGSVFDVEIADKRELRARGLSGREELSVGSGLLFIFEKSDVHSFWMKDMNFPIDIIWINEDSQIVYMKENATPQSFPEAFTPDNESLYVLEVNSGVVAENKIKIDDSVILHISSGE